MYFDYVIHYILPDSDNEVVSGCTRYSLQSTIFHFRKLNAQFVIRDKSDRYIAGSVAKNRLLKYHASRKGILTK